MNTLASCVMIVFKYIHEYSLHLFTYREVYLILKVSDVIIN